MAPIRNVIDLLSEQPEDVLRQMQERVRGQLARLRIEDQQIEQALAKQSRRQRAGGGSRGGLSKEQVFEVVDRNGVPMTAAEVRDELATSYGIDASLNNVRNHLVRLVDKQGWLIRVDGGHFMAKPTLDLSDANPADDDIPF